MGSIGMPELLVILVIVLIIFGAGRLPQIGESLGKAIRSFKESTKKDTVEPSSGRIEEVSGRKRG